MILFTNARTAMCGYLQ